jgi:hypothetical protein
MGKPRMRTLISLTWAFQVARKAISAEVTVFPITLPPPSGAP